VSLINFLDSILVFGWWTDVFTGHLVVQDAFYGNPDKVKIK